MTSLAVLVFQGQGQAYRALNLAGLDSRLEVLEIIPLGDQAQVLAKGPKDALEAWMASAAPLARTLVEEWDLRIENAFYSLKLNSANGDLVFVEGESLGALFVAASNALRSGWQIVDLKIPRGSVKWGTLILTGKSSADAHEQFAGAGVHVTAIANPSPTLKQYFEIDA